MKKQYAPLPLIAALTLLGGGANAIAANIDFHVKNCTGEKVKFKIFNGTDLIRAIPLEKFYVSGLAEGESDSAARRTHCKKRNTGKHRKDCQVRFVLDDNSAKDGGYVSSGEYFVLTKVWTKVESSLDATKITTEGEYVKASEDRKCSEL